MRKVLFAIAAATAAAVVTYQVAVRPWWKSWGVSPEEAEEALPGDDVIADANAGETRAITVNAPAAAVWPWLVQLGTGRGGWYSYEGMGMQGQSAFKVLPDFQDLKVGDLVPTYPGGGFVVSRLEPGRALVLYLDSNLAREQAAREGRRSRRRAGRQAGPRGAHGERPAHRVRGDLGLRA